MPSLRKSFLNSISVSSALVLATATYSYYHLHQQKLSALDTLSPEAGVIATASAQVLEELVITGRSPLSFGIIESATTGGEVIITPQNQRIVHGGVQVSMNQPFERAHFNIRGKADSMYVVHVPDSLVFTRQGPATDQGVSALKVTDFQSYSENLSQVSTRGQLDDQGQDTVYVGGTLLVPPTVSPGLYSGEVPLTVNY
jgi:hypothetical protein